MDGHHEGGDRYMRWLGHIPNRGVMKTIPTSGMVFCVQVFFYFNNINDQIKEFFCRNYYKY